MARRGKASKEIAARIQNGELDLREDVPGTNYYVERVTGAHYLEDGTRLPTIWATATPEELSAYKAIQHKEFKETRELRKQIYEERVAVAVSDVASLQEKALRIANDPGTIIDKDELAKLKLGLQVGDSILNRFLGKPTQHVKAEAEVSVINDMMNVAGEWLIQDADVVEEDG